jgi:KDO2-lipid IV(A) lauroyltransferase
MPEEPVQRIVWEKGRKRRRSRLRKSTTRYLNYLLIRIFHAIVSRLPLAMGRGLAWFLGTLGYFLFPRERAIARDGLTRVYGGERSPAEIRGMVRDVFRHAVGIVIDWLILRKWSPEKIERVFPEPARAIRELAAVRATSEGVVGITSHLGNWEVLGVFFNHFAPGTLVPIAQRVYYSRFQDFLHRLRTEAGGEIIYTDESPRRMIRALEDGKVLGFLPDQDVRTNSGVFVDFFGLPAYTVTFPVQLARKLDLKMGFAILVREGKSFRFTYRWPIAVPATDDKDADLLAGSEAWTRILEEEIRKRPTQWSWLHPRWRTTPAQPRRRVVRAEKGKG